MPHKSRARGKKKLKGAQLVAKKNAFLAALAECGQMCRAADAINVNPMTVRHWRANDPDFDEGCSQSIEKWGEKLEKIAFDRASYGLIPLFNEKGEPTGEFKQEKPSDMLLARMLTRWKPEYKDGEAAGGTAAIQVNIEVQDQPAVKVKDAGKFQLESEAEGSA